ncbi:MAG TPA: HAMP domain-containing sensor histidine kinase [Actinomycetota bacterium]|jgi:signal transduction histidine kinase
MSAIASTVRRHWVEVAWGAFALANVAVIVALSQWETVPFHFIWVSLTIVYGFRVWRLRTTIVLLAIVMLVTGLALWWTITRGSERLDELTEVPLMASMFLAMVWHARRRQTALEQARRSADDQQLMLERQREFVRDASHELRTPITIARGHAELIRSIADDSQVRDDATVVLDELGRLSKLSERLLILAAADHPGLLTRARIDVGELIAELERRWTPAASRAWSFRCDATGTVLADVDRVALALDALIENAVKFTAAGDPIAIGARATFDTLTIEVIDRGEGIEAAQLPRIFARFARVDGDRARGAGGTGLGLAIVRAIAEAHGGGVSAESAPGTGSTFALILPGFEASAGSSPPAPNGEPDRDAVAATRPRSS